MSAAIPSPPTASTEPDEYTQKFGKDLSHPDPVEDRCLYINTKYVKYGTNDRSQAAALMLSAAILIIVFFIILFGTIITYRVPSDVKWLETMVSWVGNAFLFTAGIAIGASGKSKSD